MISPGTQLLIASIILILLGIGAALIAKREMNKDSDFNGVVWYFIAGTVLIVGLIVLAIAVIKLMLA